MISWIGAQEAPSSMSAEGLRDEYSKLRGDLKKVRYLTTGLIAVIIVGYIFNMYGTFKAIKVDAVVQALDKEAAHVLPRAQRMAMEVGERVAPKISAAFAEQLEKTVDKLGARLDVEMKKLGEDLPKQMTAELEARLKKANKEQAELLYKSFPKLMKSGDPKRMERLLNGFQVHFSKWAQKTIVTTFAGHLKELDKIKRTLNGFVAGQNKVAAKLKVANAKEGRFKAQRITPEQLLGLWLEFMDETLKSGGESDVLTAPVEGK